MAEKHGKRWIHIDVGGIPMKEPTEVLCFWFDENQVEVLNVAGARASKDATSMRESKRNQGRNERRGTKDPQHKHTRNINGVTT
jgi:hypothetical protein